jgi:hypothetical protein
MSSAVKRSPVVFFNKDKEKFFVNVKIWFKGFAMKIA